MKTESIYIRIDAETKKLLQALAKAENRTVSNYVVWLVQKEIEKQKQG